MLIYSRVTVKTLAEHHAGGYRGPGIKMLERFGISVGDRIEVSTEENDMSGVLMPRYESASDDYIVIKLRSGYNTGIQVDKIKSLRKLKKIESSGVPKAQEIKDNKDLPKISLISTGGTIASKIDYRTGGVHAALSASELYASVPELANYASMDPEVLLSEYSENLKPEHWTVIADKVAEKVNTGKYCGVVVSHGTDTMHYTAGALSFALMGLPIPVVLVGAQRSSDRPSSDAALNLIGATVFASKSEYSGVFVAMHADSSDDSIACHIGTRVRKNHTSRRDAFESIDSTPIAIVKNDTVEMQNGDITLPKRSKGKVAANSRFDSRVGLLKYYPGFDAKIIDHVARSCKAIILEGTGLGHVSKECFPNIKKAIDAGVMVFMTSQCIWGRVSMNVYDTGRDLLNIGVVPLSDMISEIALVKAMWALANTKDANKAMQENLANEITGSIPL